MCRVHFHNGNIFFSLVFGKTKEFVEKKPTNNILNRIYAEMTAVPLSREELVDIFDNAFWELSLNDEVRDKDWGDEFENFLDFKTLAQKIQSGYFKFVRDFLTINRGYLDLEWNSQYPTIGNRPDGYYSYDRLLEGINALVLEEQIESMVNLTSIFKAGKLMLSDAYRISKFI